MKGWVNRIKGTYESSRCHSESLKKEMLCNIEGLYDYDGKCVGLYVPIDTKLRQWKPENNTIQGCRSSCEIRETNEYQYD